MNRAEFELVTNIRQSLLQFPNDWQLYEYRTLRHTKTQITIDWSYGTKITHPVSMGLSILNRLRLAFLIRSIGRKFEKDKERKEQERTARDLLGRIEKYSTRDNKFVHEL